MYDSPLGSFVSSDQGDPSPGTQVSLSDIAGGLLQSIANSAAKRAENVINPARSSNTQPIPDLSAAAAKPAVSSFMESQAFGVSIPILLIGGGALIWLLVKRR